MKQKISIILILSILTSIIYAVKNGMLDDENETYTNLKLPDVVDYNFHIKPIISDNCYTCHGPDANKRKAGLRLDLAKNALAELPENKGKFAIVPGNVSKSALYKHIVSDNPKIINSISTELENYNTARDTAIKKYVKINEEGQPATTTNNTLEFIDEAAAASFVEEMTALSDEEVDVGNIDLELLNNMEITTKQMMIISELIKE